MISNPSFRPMAPGEESRVCELAMRVFEELVAPGLSAAGVEEFARYANADALADRLRDNHFVLVAEAAGVIVGLIEARECNHISMLFVSSSARGQGVGAELVRRAIEVCRSHDSAVSDITVHSAPGASRFYRRLGFRERSGEQIVNGIRFVPMSLRLYP